MTVREDILSLLVEHGGEFHAPRGNAGTLIAEKTGHDYNNVSTTLYRMVKRGELEKEGEARRAYRYKIRETIPAGAVSRIPPHEPRLLKGQGLDGSDELRMGYQDVEARLRDSEYDEIAAGLLRRVVAIEVRHQEYVEASQGLREQLLAAEAENKQAHRHLQKCRASVASLEEERDQLIDEIRKKDSALSALHNELAEKKRGKTPIRELLDSKTIRELDRMMRERPSGKGEEG